MDQFSARRGLGVVLFDEDFDLPPPSADPEVIEPVFTFAELAAARQDAAREGREAALAEANASLRTSTRLALEEIAAQLIAAKSEATMIAEQSAEAVARLLFNCFATAFPALSARHGPAEVVAVARTILPALRREPKITVRVNPHLVTTIGEELTVLDVDLAARTRLLPTDAMGMGEARITWENGSATRDMTSIWSQIENVLAPAGLLNSAVSPSPAMVNAEPTAKEREIVE